MKRPRRVFYGWWIVAAGAALLGFGGGTYSFGFSVFFNPIQGEFDWSRAETSAAFSLASLEGGMESLIVGPLVDRFGPRRLMLLGVVLFGFGFVALSNVHSLWTFYLVYLLLALGANTATGIAPQAAVAQWFIRQASLAFGLLLSGFSVGGAVMVPFLGWLISSGGWRAAALFLGAAAWLIGIPLALVVRHKPEQYGYLPDGDPPRDSTLANAASLAREPIASFSQVHFTLREALHTRAWWFITLAFTARILAVGAVVPHEVPLLIDRGFDPQTAANLLGLTAFMGVPGRLIFGYLGDRHPKRPLLVGAILLMSLGLFILSWANTGWQVLLFAVSFGLSWGAVPLLLALRAEYFGREAFAAIGGFMMGVTGIGNVGGPIFAGWVFDVTGSYAGALMLIFAATLVGASLAFLATPPPIPARARATS